ncbi:MAG: hypothetical protein B6I24_09795 [Bacteroidetes bacterium 4572_128]|nr:MAG: hypothetical protein B6I24_09795 [Bacteroidetes bacterium 4572_128]
MKKLNLSFILLFVTLLITINGKKLFAQTETPPSVGEGTEASPYEIANLNNLYWLSQNNDNAWDKHYIQTADIDATDTENWDNGAGFTLIGLSSSNSFSGTYNGDDHIISNLFIYRPELNYVGLFGYIYSHEVAIKNIALTDVNITGKDHVGGLVGRNDGEISNSYSAGNITGKDHVGGLIGTNNGDIINSYSTASVGDGDNNSSYVGGLVGSNYTYGEISNSYSIGNVIGESRVGGLSGNNHGKISNSYSTGNVNANGESIAGLVGKNSYSGEISNSYSTGNVTSTGNYIGGLVGRNPGAINNSYSTGSVTGYSFVGGLVGNNEDYGTISNTYSTGNVTNTGNYIGGLVGVNQDEGKISNTYSTGNVTGKNFVGGLVGENKEETEIINSYSTGNVTATGYGYDIGGLVGKLDGVDAVITNSYWDIETSGQENSNGGGIGKTTAEMKNMSTYVDWDFEEVWNINAEINNGYPNLLGMPTIDIKEISEKENIKIFPNPAKDFLNIQKLPNNSDIYIMDILGKIIFYENNHFFKDFKINISDFNQGIYFIKICNKNNVFTKRIIIK